MQPKAQVLLMLLLSVPMRLYVALHRDTEPTLPVGSCNLGIEGPSAKSASQQGSSCKMNLALVASAAEICLLYPMESCSNGPDGISKCVWTPTERELQSLG